MRYCSHISQSEVLFVSAAKVTENRNPSASICGVNSPLPGSYYKTVMLYTKMCITVLFSRRILENINKPHAEYKNKCLALDQGVVSGRTGPSQGHGDA